MNKFIAFFIVYIALHSTVFAKTDLKKWLEDLSPTVEVDGLTLTRSNVNFNDVYQYGGIHFGYVARYPSYSSNRDNEEYFANSQSRFEKMLNSFLTVWNFILYEYYEAKN